jgi:hypothetical protein
MPTKKKTMADIVIEGGSRSADTRLANYTQLPTNQGELNRNYFTFK